MEGTGVGFRVGASVGIAVGTGIGVRVGAEVGISVGTRVGVLISAARFGAPFSEIADSNFVSYIEVLVRATLASMVASMYTSGCEEHAATTNTERISHITFLVPMLG